jgi:hypothetical protein
MTAYRQQALACAAALQAGPARPRDLRAVAPAAGQILLQNFYGWFERTGRGVYRITAAGEAALQRWPVAGAAHSEMSSGAPAGLEQAEVAG